SAVADSIGDRFPDSDVAPVQLVVDRDGAPLQPEDLQAAREMGAALAEVAGHEASPVIPAEDGAAALVSVPITLGADNSANAEIIKDLRAAVAEQAVPGLRAQITGGPAFGADIASSFDGADLTLLVVTVGIVTVLLIATYRSPVLFLRSEERRVGKKRRTSWTANQWTQKRERIGIPQQQDDRTV